MTILPWSGIFAVLLLYWMELQQGLAMSNSMSNQHTAAGLSQNRSASHADASSTQKFKLFVELRETPRLSLLSQAKNQTTASIQLSPATYIETKVSSIAPTAATTAAAHTATPIVALTVAPAAARTTAALTPAPTLPRKYHVRNILFSQSSMLSGGFGWSINHNIKQIMESECGQRRGTTSRCTIKEIKKILGAGKRDFLTLDAFVSRTLNTYQRDHPQSKYIGCNNRRLCFLKQLDAMGLFDGKVHLKLKKRCSHSLTCKCISIIVKGPKRWCWAGCPQATPPERQYGTCPQFDHSPTMPHWPINGSCCPSPGSH